jgi:hypothetical protein
MLVGDISLLKFKIRISRSSILADIFFPLACTNMSTPSSFFSHLPVDIFRLIFEYLTLPTISRLDRALTHHQIRSIYLTALTGYPLPDLKKIQCTSLLMHWLHQRQIFIHTLIIGEYDSNTTRLIQQNHSTLRSIKLLNSNTPPTRAYFNQSPPPPENIFSPPSTHSPASFSSPAEEFFIALSTAPLLTTLIFEDCQMITDAHLFTLLHGTAHFKHLNLSNCSQLTHIALTLITQSTSCQHLEQLSLASLSSLSNHDLELLPLSCPFLTHLDLSKGDTTLSDDIIPILLTAYPNLQALILYNCTNISLRMKAKVLRTVTVPQLSSSDPELHLLGSRSLRKALSDGLSPTHDLCLTLSRPLSPLSLVLILEYLPPLDEVVEMGVIPRLIEFLSFNSSPVSDIPPPSTFPL